MIPLAIAAAVLLLAVWSALAAGSDADDQADARRQRIADQCHAIRPDHDDLPLTGRKGAA